MATKLRKTMGKKYNLLIRWAAGHIGIAGNKEMDEEVKVVEEVTTSDTAKLPKALRKPLRTSRLVMHQQLNKTKA